MGLRMKKYILLLAFSLIFSTDYYVSLSGDDFNGDGTENNPYKSITRAIYVASPSASNNVNVYVDEGLYSFSTSGDYFPILIPSYVNVEGLGRELTVIDAERSNRVINFINSSFSSLSKLTITGGDTAIDLANPNYDAGISILNSSPSIIEVDIVGNQAGWVAGGVGIRNNSSPFFFDVNILGNSSLQSGGGIHCFNSSAIFENVIISDNTAQHSGGGFDMYACTNLEFKNVEVTNNQSIYSGGGIHLNNYDQDAGVSTFNNVLVSGNSAGHSGGGFQITNGDIKLNQVTVVDNTSDAFNDPQYQHYGGGIATWETSGTIVNSIIRGNFLYTSSLDFQGLNSSSIIMGYSNVGQVNGIISAGGFINADPMFNNPQNGDYSLSSDSPCIDSGTAYLEAFGNVELDLNESEYYGLAPDMGAFEFDAMVGDLNSDFTVNIQDIVLMVNLILSNESSSSADLNSDGLVNVLDVVGLVNLILG